MLVVVMFLQGSMQSSPRLERGEEEHEEVGLKLVALSVEHRRLRENFSQVSRVISSISPTSDKTNLVQQ